MRGWWVALGHGRLGFGAWGAVPGLGGVVLGLRKGDVGLARDGFWGTILGF